jgi:hypothetical protein
MRGVVRTRLPGPIYFFLAISLLLAGLVIYYFFISNGAWTIPARNRPKTLGKAQLTLSVWTDKRTGFYYCPDSHLYGHTESGRYMSQGEALQDGYTAAMNEPCR